jgi:hypothetical protein
VGAFVKTLANPRDRQEVLDRLAKVREDSQRRWGSMTANQMVCHLSDSFRVSLGEKHASPAMTFANRTIVKWAALWLPTPWPHGVKTRPEVDPKIGGTLPTDFASDVATLHALVERFCSVEGEFAPHPMFGQVSRAERMRHAYLHMNHHLRQFGA